MLVIASEAALTSIAARYGHDNETGDQTVRFLRLHAAALRLFAPFTIEMCS